jgi:hypothetical protein
MHSARASFEEISDQEAGMIYHTHVFGFAALRRLEDGTYCERQVRGCGERKIRLLGRTPIGEGYLIGKLQKRPDLQEPDLLRPP